MAPLCALEEKHGVDLGSGYKNDKACATFVEYIAQQQRKLLTSTLAKAKFFSIQADGSTNVGNVENELFLALYLDPHAPGGARRSCVVSRANFLVPDNLCVH